MTRNSEVQMKQIMIMRHAKSSWKDGSLSDHDRTLNPRGLDTAPKMAEYAFEHECLPELILSSTAARALSTAMIFAETVCKSGGAEIPIVTQRRLYHPGLDDYCETVYSKVQESQQRIMIVSHNPGSEEWVYQLTKSYETMPTAAIAVVELEEDFEWYSIGRKTKGKLLDVWRPKEVL